MYDLFRAWSLEGVINSSAPSRKATRGLAASPRSASRAS
jgi:hypothetical protein